MSIKKFVVILIIIAGIGAVFGVIIINSLSKTTPSPTSISKPRYIALGDSVAAGVGKADAYDFSACDRTAAAYPKLIADEKQFDLTFLACSGATINNGVLGPQIINRLELRSQIQASTDMENVKLITLTIGANDVDWLNILSKCYQATCGDSSDTTGFTAKLTIVSKNYDEVADRLKNNYPSAQIILSGYYLPFPDTDSTDCSELNGIDQSELSWLRNRFKDLNAAIKEVAQGNALSYAAPDFNGHELCSSDAWVQSLSEKNPYHPNELGQDAIARSIVKVLR